MKSFRISKFIPFKSLITRTSNSIYSNNGKKSAQFRDFIWHVISFDAYMLFKLEQTNKRISQSLRSDNGLRIRAFLRENLNLVRPVTWQYSYEECKMLLRSRLITPCYILDKFYGGEEFFIYDIFSLEFKTIKLVDDDINFH